MAMANDMSALIEKITSNLGLIPLLPHLPEFVSQQKWVDDVIMKKTIETFSRYYPNKFPMVVDETTCDKKVINGSTWYYIKDEILDGVKLLGVKDIDWTDHSTKNSGLGSRSLGGGYFYPSHMCLESTVETYLGLQMSADFTSLYNRNLVIDFQYPNRFRLLGIGNTNYDPKSFVIDVLVEHCSLSTISPTKMETFEELAQCDIAQFLYMNLRYFNGFDTAYINIDLKLEELQDEANKRKDVIDTLKESYVSTSNDNIPYMFTV